MVLHRGRAAVTSAAARKRCQHAVPGSCATLRGAKPAAECGSWGWRLIFHGWKSLEEAWEALPVPCSTYFSPSSIPRHKRRCSKTLVKENSWAFHKKCSLGK